MATISLNIPDPALPRVVAMLCDKGGWSAADGPQNAFAKKVLAQGLKDDVRAYERRKAEQAALAAAPPPDVIDIT